MPSRSSQKAGRKPTGSVVERTNKRGKVFALRFRAYGEREYETLGSEADGWTRQLAGEEIDRRLAQVKLGQYVPQARIEPEPTEAPEPGFRELAWEWLADQALAESTRSRYELDVQELVAFFGEGRPSQIDARRIDAYKRHMLRRTRKRDDKPLSHETINKTLTRLGQVPGRAKRYGYIAQNPVHERGVKLKTRKPQRSYLDSGEQITALLEAAKGLDGKGAKVKPYRHAMVATLVFSGLRLGELLALRWRDVDLAEGWLHVKQEGDGKTEAATRRVKLRPVLREVLTERKAARNAIAATSLSSRPVGASSTARATFAPG